MGEFSYWNSNTIHYYCDRQSKQEYLYLSMDDDDPNSIIHPTKEYPLGWVFCTLYRCLLQLSKVSGHYNKNRNSNKAISFTMFKFEKPLLDRYIKQAVYFNGERIHASTRSMKESSRILYKYIRKMLYEMNGDVTLNNKIEDFMNFVDLFMTNADDSKMTLAALAKYCDKHNYKVISGNKVFAPDRIVDVSNKEIYASESVEKNEQQDEALKIYSRRVFKTKSNRIADQKYNELTFDEQNEFLSEFFQLQEYASEKKTRKIEIRDYRINSIEYLFIAALQEIINARFTLRKCERCGGIFVAKRKNARYCEFRHPKLENRTCRQYESLLKQRQREREDICSRVYRKISAMLLQRTLKNPEKGDSVEEMYEEFLSESWERRKKIRSLSAKSQKHTQEVVYYLLWASSFYRDNRYEGEFEMFVYDNALKIKDADPQEKQKDNETNDMLIATYHHMKALES